MECDTFIFEVGDEEYECNRFQAAFISNRVHRMLQSDRVVDRLEFRECECNKEAMRNIVSLMNGESIAVNQYNCDDLLAICKILENEELMSKILEFKFDQEPISPSNYIRIIKKTLTNNCKFLPSTMN
jgi:hypothetical protein